MNKVKVSIVLSILIMLVSLTGTAYSQSTKKLTLSAVSPLKGVAGRPATFTFKATGGKAPYSYSISKQGQPLPPGLALVPSTTDTVTITGTDALVETDAFVLKAHDASKHRRTGHSSFSITFSDPAQEPDFDLTITPSSQTVTAGSSTSYTLGVQGLRGFNDPVTLSMSVPSGFSATFSPDIVSAGSQSNLTIATFSNASPATYTLTVVAQASGISHSVNCALVVNAYVPPPAVQILDKTPLPDAVVGQAYSYQFHFSGGTAPYVATLDTELTGCDFCTLSASGELNAVPPKQGAWSIVIKVHDSGDPMLFGTTNAPFYLHAYTSTANLPVQVALEGGATSFAVGDQITIHWTFKAGQGGPYNTLVNLLNTPSAGAAGAVLYISNNASTTVGQDTTLTWKVVIPDACQSGECEPSTYAIGIVVQDPDWAAQHKGAPPTGMSVHFTIVPKQ